MGAGWDVAHEFLLYLQWCICRLGHESQTVAHTIYMSVDGHCRLSERHCLHHIGCLAAHTGQTQQTVKIVRHFATIIALYHARQLYKMSCLGVGIAYALDILVDLCLVGLRHGMSIRIMAKEFGSDLIDSLVGALRTKYYGNEQLKY